PMAKVCRSLLHGRREGRNLEIEADFVSLEGRDVQCCELCQIHQTSSWFTASRAVTTAKSRCGGRRAQGRRTTVPWFPTHLPGAPSRFPAATASAGFRAVPRPSA